MVKNYIKSRLKQFTSPWYVLTIDLFLITSAYIIAAFIKYAFVLSFAFYATLYQLPLILIVFLVVFLITKSYRGVIRYTSLKDMSRIGFTLLLALTILLIFDIIINQTPYKNTVYDLKRSTLLIHFMLNINILIFSRLCFSYIYNRVMLSPEVKTKAYIYGAGQMGIAVHNLFINENNINIVGFIDDDLNKKGKRVNNLVIHNPTKISKKNISKENVKELYIAINNLSKSKIKSISNQFLAYGVKPKLIPSFQKWVDGVLDTNQIKDVKIEDLLARDIIELNKALWTSKLTDKTILVTGGAGSIGSEIVRQLSNFNINQIIILDQSESSLYDLEQELLGSGFNKFTPIIADVSDKLTMESMFKTHTPSIIFHAAAYKHVPLMEAFPKQSIRVNLGGAKIVSDLAIAYGADRFVMVSTDKAVNPTNVMGATKRAAEIYIASLSGVSKTKFMTTRFGNVLGSNGSVIPLFRKQIREGGPLTVTHKNIIRYFMTIPEASQLVIEAGISGNGGEIFVFDMGNPIKIYNLALNMIKLSGFKFPDEIDIKITGLRPGEKLYEELLQDKENSLPTHHKKIKIAKTIVLDAEESKKTVNNLLNNLPFNTKKEVVKQLKKIVPEFLSKNSPYQTLD